MNSERNLVRRLIAVLMLAAVLATTSGVLAHADTLEAGGGTPGESFVVDGMWATATCGFSMALARFDPGFYGSALLICEYAQSLDQ